MSIRTASWVVRACFGTVFAWNAICAVQFIVAPSAFVGAYQLSGVSGEVAIQGLGVAFLMWNATYPAFIAFPVRFKALGWVILAQQLIGCMGEVFIWAGLPASGFNLLSSSILRFLAFDVAGLILMALSYLVMRRAFERNQPIGDGAIG